MNRDRTPPRLAGALTRTRTMLLACLIVATLLLPDAPFVAAKVVEDATCAIYSGSLTDLVGSKSYSQSFTASHTGKLTRGFIETYNVQNASATYTVELWAADASGLPAGVGPLASTTVLNPRSGHEFDYPIFETPAKVKSGRSYALVVTVPDPNNNGVTVGTNDPCASQTFALSNAAGFQADPNHRDLRFAVSIKVRRHRHHRH